MPFVIAIGAPAIILATILGDAALGAFIAGAFSVLNTLLLWRLNRGHRRVERAITAPRRLLYDQEGRPIGTVLDLRRGDGWDEKLIEGSRRHDDPPPPP